MDICIGRASHVVLESSLNSISVLPVLAPKRHLESRQTQSGTKFQSQKFASFNIQAGLFSNVYEMQDIVPSIYRYLAR
jgi:hypothetical protein